MNEDGFVLWFVSFISCCNFCMCCVLVVRCLWSFVKDCGVFWDVGRMG